MGNIHEVEWKQLTLGHLSRNKFWGEDPDTQYHSVVASSTLVRDGDINILVDPTLLVDEMESRLKRNCGIDRKDIHIIFATLYVRGIRKGSRLLARGGRAFGAGISERRRF